MRINNNSQECAKSELDIFSIPPTQTGIEEAYWDTIIPHPNFNQSDVIRFDVTGTNSHYIDLGNTELHVKFRIHKSDKSPYDPVATALPQVYVVNNLLHSIFEQAQVFLNNVPVENTNKSYGYRAYMENLLCYSSEAKKTFLRGDFWFKDDHGKFDKYTDLSNSGVSKRYSFYSKAGTTEVLNASANPAVFYDPKRYAPAIAVAVPLMGKIHCDIFNVNRYLLNNVDINLVLTKARDRFFFKGKDSVEYKFEIMDTFLKIRRIVVSPSVMLAHAMALEKTTAKYPIKRVLVKPFVIPYSSPTFTLTGIHFGVMPSRVVFGIVDTASYNGTIDTNPFNFKNYNIEQVCLKISSRSLPYSTPLKMNFNTNDYIEGYMSLFKNIREAGNDITYEEYKDGYTLFAFDLTPDLCSAEHYSLLKDGSLDLDLVMASGEGSKTIIFYLEFDNIIEITKDRQVLVDYKL